MATYTAMAGFSAGHCIAFVVYAAERAAIQFRVTSTFTLVRGGDDAVNPNISDGSELREAGFDRLTTR